MKLSIELEVFQAPFRTALARAAKLGVAGVVCDAIDELAPPQLSATGRREIQNLLRSHDLSLAAIVCPLRRGLDDPIDLEPRLARIRDTMTLSVDLGARLVVIDPGPIPTNVDDPRHATFLEGLGDLSKHGDRTGAILALNVSADRAAVAAAILSRFDTGGLGVCFDPAQSYQSGFDPIDELRSWSGRIVHVHAADARRRGSSRTAEVVPLGHGDLDWLQIAGTLAAQDYRGWIAIDRRGMTSDADLAASVSFLRRLL